MQIQNQPKKWFVWVFAIIVLITLTGCEQAREEEKNYEKREYSIDPGTIIKNIYQGNQDVFTLLEENLQTTPLTPTEKISWREEDYFRIMQILPEYAWKEPLDEAAIFQLNFDMDCEEAPNSLFKNMSIRSFKLVDTDGQEIRVDFRYIIKPEYHEILTSRAEYTPNVNKWRSIDLPNFQITAEEAARIAEKNGGAEKRLEYENDCIIHVLANGLKKKTEWVVSYKSYRDGDWHTLFEIAINPQTGAFRIIVPKKK